MPLCNSFVNLKGLIEIDTQKCIVLNVFISNYNCNRDQIILFYAILSITIIHQLTNVKSNEEIHMLLSIQNNECRCVPSLLLLILLIMNIYWTSHNLLK